MSDEIALPTGTVTFLFTDIVGSTPLWESQPELMAQALTIHNDALRQAIQANRGVVFKTVGDAFQAAFPTALDGLKAAIAGQRALQRSQRQDADGEYPDSDYHLEDGEAVLGVDCLLSSHR